MGVLKNFRRGDTYQVRLVFSGQDITGWAFTFTLKASLSDTIPALQIQQVAGDGPNDLPAEGVITLEITSTQSAELIPGSYYYDIQRVIAGTPPNVRTILPPIDSPNEKIKVIEDVSV